MAGDGTGASVCGQNLGIGMTQGHWWLRIQGTVRLAVRGYLVNALPGSSVRVQPGLFEVVSVCQGLAGHFRVQLGAGGGDEPAVLQRRLPEKGTSRQILGRLSHNQLATWAVGSIHNGG